MDLLGLAQKSCETGTDHSDPENLTAPYCGGSLVTSLDAEMLMTCAWCFLATRASEHILDSAIPFRQVIIATLTPQSAKVMAAYMEALPNKFWELRQLPSCLSACNPEISLYEKMVSLKYPVSIK